MAAQSLEIAAGLVKVMKTQYNNLRKDVLDPTLGHGHTGGADDGKLLPNIVKGLQGNPLRIEHKRATSNGSNGAVEFTVTWDNAFTTILGVICSPYANQGLIDLQVTLIYQKAWTITGATCRVGYGGNDTGERGCDFLGIGT
jgi:hypothetical protein